MHSKARTLPARPLGNAAAQALAGEVGASKVSSARLCRSSSPGRRRAAISANWWVWRAALVRGPNAGTKEAPMPTTVWRPSVWQASAFNTGSGCAPTRTWQLR